LAFGLEALLLGLGGKLLVLYRRQRVRTFGLAFSTGIIIIVPAIITSIVFTLEPLYFCVLVLVYTFIMGRIIKMLGRKIVGTPPPLLLKQPSELEVVTMLRKRGYDKLVKKDSTEPSRISSPAPSELNIVEDLRRTKRGRPTKKKRKT